MVYHILNGDALAYSFPEAKIDGQLIVIREGLIDGNLAGDRLPDFWKSRATYLGISDREYQQNVVAEFEKIRTAPEHAEFNLWFEYDLFCQVNMWFVLSIINDLGIKKNVFAVYTTHVEGNNPQFWNGFGPANSTELNYCFANRISLDSFDLQLGKDLWSAYKNNNLEELNLLAGIPSAAFPYLKEVIKAHVDRNPMDGSPGRPEKIIAEIIQSGTKDFQHVFKEFWARESIYGFGDVQLKSIYDRVLENR